MLECSLSTSSEKPFNTDGECPIHRHSGNPHLILFRETGARRNDVIDIYMDELDKNDGKVFSQKDLELGFVATSLIFFVAGFTELHSYSINCQFSLI